MPSPNSCSISSSTRRTSERQSGTRSILPERARSPSEPPVIRLPRHLGPGGLAVSQVPGHRCAPSVNPETLSPGEFCSFRLPARCDRPSRAKGRGKLLARETSCWRLLNASWFIERIMIVNRYRAFPCRSTPTGRPAPPRSVRRKVMVSKNFESRILPCRSPSHRRRQSRSLSVHKLSKSNLSKFIICIAARNAIISYKAEQRTSCAGRAVDTSR